MEDLDYDDKMEEYTKLLLKDFQMKPKKSNYRFETDAGLLRKKSSSQINTDSIIITSLGNKSKNKNLTKEKGIEKGKGSLYKYINSSYFKRSFGSIPSKSEKFLLNDKRIVDRFSGINSFFNQQEETPGVGSYNLNKDWNLKNKSVKFDTEDKRFSNRYNFSPGVGEYNLDSGKVFQQEKDNLRYNNLYSKTKALLNLNINSNKNIFTYEPQLLNDLIKNKKNYNFNSYSGRNNYRGSKIQTLFDKKNDYPGPGQYFQNSHNLSKRKYSFFNIRNKNNMPNENCKSKKFFNEYFNDSKIKEDKPSFIMKQNGNKRENKVYHLEDIHNLNNSFKEIIIDKNKELEEKLRENEKTFTSNNLYFKIKEKMELNKIKVILGNDNGKPDFFYLSPERWKNKKNVFKPPGPAYYFY